MWEIKGKNNQTKAIIHALEYNGEWMNESYVTTTIQSPTPIKFAIGDWLSYRGERFETNYDPGKVKTAEQFQSGSSFIYENIKFNSLADELTRCDFLDYVLNDNQFHFTGLPKFSFYGGVQNLADRIQANLDRAYGKNKWRVVLSPDFSDTKELNVTVDTIKVQGALAILVNDYKTYYTIKGRVITIGATGVQAGHLFKYGPGMGLYEFEQNAESDQQIVTRLRAYGSTRNLPYRYYNSLTGADGKKLIPDNMAVQYLMLPEFPYTTRDPYINSKNISDLGIREGTIFFDGSQEGLEEIYPSIEGMTAEQLKAAGVPCNSTGALDEIVSAEQITDNGVGDVDEDQTEPADGKSTFKVVVKDLGFNIWEHRTGEAPAISFKTGKLGGREFEIVGCEEIKNSAGKIGGYELELNRVYDEDIKLWFPYASYNAQSGDKFVLLYIKMPEVYIKAAAQRLKTAAETWLAKNDYSRSVYAPKVDEIFMARQHDEAMASGGTVESLHDTLREGMIMLFEDEDLNVDAAVVIDRLTIKEGDGPIPTYEVVLKEEKTVGRLDKMQNQIDSIASGQGQGIGGYTAQQIRRFISVYGKELFLSKVTPDQAQEIIKFLDGLDTGNYTPGVSGGHIGAEGDGELETLQLRKSLRLGDYVPGVSGGTFYIDANGEAHIDTAYLTVNKKMTVKELEIQQQRWVGGSQISSPAGMVCGRVEPVYAEDGTGTIHAWRCFFRATDADGRKIHNEFRVNDLARCETFNLMRDAQGMLQNRYYWRRVEYVSEDANPIVDDAGDAWHQINLSNGQGRYDPASNCAPAPGDHIITLGNATDPSRQNAIVIASYGEGAPYIYQLTGIDSFTTAGRVKTRISPNGNHFTGEFRLEVGGEDKGDIGELLSSADGKITTLEATSDGIMGKVGKISRNLLRFNKGAWKDVYGIWAVSEQPAKGAFYCSQMDEWPEDKDTAYFRCAVDLTLFKPDTDYILTLYATWRSDITDDEGTDMPASMTMWASIQSADVNSVMAPTVRAEGEPYVWGRRIKQTFRLHTNKTWDPRSQMLNLRFFTGAGAPAWPTLTQFDVEEIKLEQGTFATPFVPGEQDIESVISQQADQIAMSVKVDGKERAGMTLDAEKGVTLQSDKVQIKNGDEIAALFTGGMLNANLINVGKLTTIVDGLKRITVSEFGDAFIRFYHRDGITVACKLGLENVILVTGGDLTPVPTAANAQALTDSAISGDISITTGKPAIIQVYNEAGDLTWVLFLDGPVTPDTQTYSWRTLSLVAPGSASQDLIATAATLKATEYWQFRVSGDKGKEPYLSQAGKVFTKKLADNEFTGAASYYVPNGRYYSPSVEIAPAAPGEATTWRRRYYQITNGIMGPAQYITVTP